jgi:hypothetical protein
MRRLDPWLSAYSVEHDGQLGLCEQPDATRGAWQTAGERPAEAQGSVLQLVFHMVDALLHLRPALLDQRGQVLLGQACGGDRRQRANDHRAPAPAVQAHAPR